MIIENCKGFVFKKKEEKKATTIDQSLIQLVLALNRSTFTIYIKWRFVGVDNKKKRFLSHSVWSLESTPYQNWIKNMDGARFLTHSRADLKSNPKKSKHNNGPRQNMRDIS